MATTRLKNTVLMTLFFCKDILDDVEYGIQLINAFNASFESTEWPDLPKDRSFDDYMTTYWVREDDLVDVHLFHDKAKRLKFTVINPPTGGSKVFSVGGKRMFHTGTLEMHISPDTYDGTIEDDLKRVFPRLFMILEAPYGFIAYRSQLLFGWGNIDERLPGIFWITGFGPDYVDIIGGDRFRQSTDGKVDTLEDGSKIVTASPSLKESATWGSWWTRRRIMRILGKRHFRKPLFGHNPIPTLRNLKPPQEDDGI